MGSKIRLAVVILVSISLFSTVAFAKSSKKIPVLIAFKGVVNDQVVTDVGGKVKHKMKHEKLVEAEIPETSLTALQSSPDVEFVEQDGLWSASTQSVPWGVDRVEADVAQVSGVTGKGIRVAILDSGISAHEDLQVAGGWNFVNKSADYSDDFGHGTLVAGTISALDNTIGVVGVGPEAQIYSLKVLDQTGNANWSTIAKGLDWAIANKMNIINMSFGGNTKSKTIEKLLNHAYSSGILLVAAAGNDGGPTVNYPANYSSVIAVGATDETNSIAPFSNTGPKIELVAPGVSILSTDRNGSFSSVSGTSFSAPHVTGVAALIWSKNPGFSNVEIRNCMNSNALDLGPSGKDTTFGSGLVNFR